MGKFRTWLIKIIANGDMSLMNVHVNGKYIMKGASAVYIPANDGKLPPDVKAVITPLKCHLK